MAALDDLSWIVSMSSKPYSQDNGSQPDSRQQQQQQQPPQQLQQQQQATVAAFSPSTLASSALSSRQRSSIIVHRKSPLLVATPPAVTRALAYSHPFILPLNVLAGLLTWTSGDAWQSFLLLSGFWTVVLYSDAIILWAGPILVVIGLILGMYSRRYSPLSSTALTGEKHVSGSRKGAIAAATAAAASAASDRAEQGTYHHKSLDEIVETLRALTDRCNILLRPLLDLTDFLSTQRTATSATTKPALTALFLRILLLTPVWILLTLPPFYIITTRRVVMAVGTVILTYHSEPARVARVILWRSLTVRRICAIITGLKFSAEPEAGDDADSTLGSPQRHGGHSMHIATRRRGSSSGIRFTFVLYENQRRWLGIGWTYSLFPAERAAWTDEHLNPAPSKDEFELPEVQGGNARWRWVEGSCWRIEGADDQLGKASKSSGSDGGGWIYYDNKWNDGRRGQDGWDRYTRRRKWYRDAELVEAAADSHESGSATQAGGLGQPDTAGGSTGFSAADSIAEGTGNSNSSSSAASVSRKPPTVRRRWFSSSKIETASGSSSDAAATTAVGASPGSNSQPRPASLRHSRIPSGRVDSSQSYGGGSSNGNGNSNGGGGGGGKDSVNSVNSDSASVRKKEIARSQDHLDHWAARAAGGTERAEREMGLSDDVNMGLS